MSKKCSECQTENSNEAELCHRCGIPLKDKMGEDNIELSDKGKEAISYLSKTILKYNHKAIENAAMNAPEKLVICLLPFLGLGRIIPLEMVWGISWKRKIIEKLDWSGFLYGYEELDINSIVDEVNKCGNEELLKYVSERLITETCAKKEYIRTAKDGLSGFGWKKVFFEYSFIHTNKDKARECLEQQEYYVVFHYEWIFLAQCYWYQYKDNSKGSLCLEKAESIAKDSSDWLHCALEWMELFGDNDKAQLCLEKAESIAKDSSDYLHCAFKWMELFGEDPKAQICLEKAESKAKCTRDWTKCAWKWKELFGDNDKAQICLEKAELKAERTFHWTDCAGKWKVLLGDDSKALKCLKKAESTVKGSHDWFFCAWKWKNLFGDNDKAQLCLEKTESKAELSFQWADCAMEWKNLFGDNDKAQLCLEKAELIAINSADWLRCATEWMELFGDNDMTQMCLKKAELSAQDSSDLKECDRISRKLFGKNSKAVKNPEGKKTIERKESAKENRNDKNPKNLRETGEKSEKTKEKPDNNRDIDSNITKNFSLKEVDDVPPYKFSPFPNINPLGSPEEIRDFKNKIRKRVREDQYFTIVCYDNYDNNTVVQLWYIKKLLEDAKEKNWKIDIPKYAILVSPTEKTELIYPFLVCCATYMKERKTSLVPKDQIKDRLGSICNLDAIEFEIKPFLNQKIGVFKFPGTKASEHRTRNLYCQEFISFNEHNIGFNVCCNWIDRDVWFF